LSALTTLPLSNHFRVEGALCLCCKRDTTYCLLKWHQEIWSVKIIPWSFNPAIDQSLIISD